MSEDEFWPTIHVLAGIFDAERFSADERQNAVVEKFRDFPPTVQRQLVADTFRFSMELQDLYATIAVETNRAGPLAR